MKITFFSNYLNHLQTPFCNDLYEKFGSNFTFVSTKELTNEMRNNGYLEYDDCPYNLQAYQSQENYQKSLELGLNSDVVIIGSAPEIYIKERLKQNRLTFRYSERLFKNGAWRLLDPRVLLTLVNKHTRYRNNSLYMLCASGYAAKDLNLIFAYPGKKFKWGYFTLVEELDIESVLNLKPTKKIEILWTARFLDWKHPELAIKLAYALKKDKLDFTLTMIGVGIKYNYIEEMIKKLGLSECVNLLQSVPNNTVRDIMKNSNIFIQTSDKAEGWGVVINEAMSQGCAVIASDAIGSTPYLIQNNVNGLVFKSEDLGSLINQTKKLIEDKILRETLGKAAYYTLRDIWNAKYATTRFLKLVNSIQVRKPANFSDGPCSPA